MSQAIRRVPCLLHLDRSDLARQVIGLANWVAYLIILVGDGVIERGRDAAVGLNDLISIVVEETCSAYERTVRPVGFHAQHVAHGIVILIDVAAVAVLDAVQAIQRIVAIGRGGTEAIIGRPRSQISQGIISVTGRVVQRVVG